MAQRRISVVLPVYEEQDNIGACLRGLWAALQSHGHEILVCYDFEEDPTLAAIRAMDDAPPTLRLVVNAYGRGAANAIRSGFEAARGDVVVTTMADLSDPPQKIPELARRMRARGAAVVAGSRYVRGGSQHGGPWLKRTLSRLAGLSLRWIAGLGTHDSTTNFRAYSREFLRRTEVESSHAFDVALELTVKAHLAGETVDEIPSAWTDRSAGESRFQLWAWAPKYLRWYWMAMREPLAVWTLWLAALAAAPWLGLWRQLGAGGSAALQLACAASAAYAILIARSRRGRTVLGDALLPLVSSAALHGAALHAGWLWLSAPAALAVMALRIARAGAHAEPHGAPQGG